MWPLVGVVFIMYPKPDWLEIHYFFSILLPFTGFLCVCHHPYFLSFPFLSFPFLPFPSLPFPFCSFLFFFHSQIPRHRQTWIHTPQMFTWAKGRESSVQKFHKYCLDVFRQISRLMYPTYFHRPSILPQLWRIHIFYGCILGIDNKWSLLKSR